ncbi:hypothetical protein ABPG72_017193 [Tetrahymena utriculariae]
MMQNQDQIIQKTSEQSTYNYPFLCIEINKGSYQKSVKSIQIKEALSIYPNIGEQQVQIITGNNSEWFSQNNFAEEINKNNILTNLELRFNDWENFGEIEMIDLGNQLNKCHNLKKLRLIIYKNTFLNAYKILQCYNITHLIISFQCRNNEDFVSQNSKYSLIESLKKTYFQFCKFQNLEELTIYQYSLGLTDDTIDLLGSNLQLCKNLKKLTLRLSTNPLGYQGVALLGKHISKMVQLVELYLALEENNIQNDGVNILGQSLCSLINLSSLTLLFYKNQIEEQGIDALMKSIQFLNLHYLYVSFSQNQIQDGGLNKFSQYIPNFKELKSLRVLINETKISEQSLLQIIQQIQICKNIKIFKVEANNQYNDYSINQMLNLLKALTQLNSLNFYIKESYKKCNKKLQMLIQKKLVRLVDVPNIVI